MRIYGVTLFHQRERGREEGRETGREGGGGREELGGWGGGNKQERL